jgi:hypothetical protein
MRKLTEEDERGDGKEIMRVEIGWKEKGAG